MADIKWSAFPDGGAIVDSDKSVGLRSGANMQFDANIFGDDITVNGLDLGVGAFASTTNTAFGLAALNSNSSGIDNVAIGKDALTANSSGKNNTCVGSAAGEGISIGQLNVVVGKGAMGAGNSCNSTVAIGGGSGTALGAGAVAITSGSQNTFIGTQSGANSAIAEGTIAIGRDSVSTAETGATSGDDGPGIAIGSAGFPVGFRGDSSIYPGAFGRVKWNGTQYMLPLQPDGATSIAVTSGGTGLSSTTVNELLYSSATDTIAGLTTANDGLLVTSATGVPSIGNDIGADITVNGLTVGRGGAGISTNIGIGGLVNAATTGTSNIAIGLSTMSAAVSGASNIAIGSSAMSSAVSTVENLVIGSIAANQLNTGDNNVILGAKAGGSVSAGTSMTSASNNTCIGYQSGVDSASAIGCLSLGRDAVSTIATGATSGDDGPGVAIGAAAFPVGFRGDASIYPAAGTSAGYVRVKWNGVNYKMLLMDDV